MAEFSPKNIETKVIAECTHEIVPQWLKHRGELKKQELKSVVPSSSVPSPDKTSSDGLVSFIEEHFITGITSPAHKQ